MKLTIVSNYINHHQIPMSNELYRKLGAAFAFIQTSPMEEDRVKMGWGEEVRSIPYLKLYYEEPEACAARILCHECGQNRDSRQRAPLSRGAVEVYLSTGQEKKV